MGRGMGRGMGGSACCGRGEEECLGTHDRGRAK